MSGSDARVDSATGDERGGRRVRLPTIVFLGLQGLVVAALLGLGFDRYRDLGAERELPPLREKPLEIRPLYDDPRVVADEELARILRRIGVAYRGAETSIGHVDHLLRMWGPTLRPPSEGLMSGVQMRALLTDHREFALTYGEDADPLLLDDGTGIRVRAFEGATSSAHLDHTLATLAEIGSWSHLPIVTPLREATLREMLEQSLRDFRLDQFEYEWSAATYALFLPPVSRWRSSDGQEITFDRLAARLLREELPAGVCAGNHRLYSLVLILRADDLMVEQWQPPLLSGGRRQEILDFLSDATERLVRHQHEQGFWGFRWPEQKPESAEPTDVDGDRLGDRLIATGHTLEWWALAPPEVQPPREVVMGAGRWLVEVIDALDDEEVQRFGSFLSHAGRALALWRGRLPSEVSLEPAEEASG